jgi:hypothetical protein
MEEEQRVLNDLEDQAFLRSYDSSPRPPLPPPPLSVVFLSQSFCVSLVELTDGRRRWARNQNHTTPRKHGPLYSIQYSLKRKPKKFIFPPL